MGMIEETGRGGLWYVPGERGRVFVLEWCQFQISDIVSSGRWIFLSLECTICSLFLVLYMQCRTRSPITQSMSFSYASPVI